MTEQQFDNKVEHLASQFENSVERGAARFDRAVSHSFRKPRRIFRAISTLLAVALVAFFWIFDGALGTTRGILGIAALLSSIFERILFQ